MTNTVNQNYAFKENISEQVCTVLQAFHSQIISRAVLSYIQSTFACPSFPVKSTVYPNVPDASPACKKKPSVSLSLKF